jgi:PD-(D/E)XK endonuclease
MSPKQERAVFGRATQARFLLDATARGMTVSLPFDSVPGYDAVADTGKRTFLVQIKGARKCILTTTNRGRQYKYLRYTVNLRRHRKEAPRCDVFAAWLDGDSRWAFFPREIAKSHTNIRFHGNAKTVGWEIFDAPKIDTISEETPPAIPAETQPTSSS